ncbi:acyltransferase [Calothrix sp. 336/3]|uniref:acyltransferase family protein n=1 Tax=Calothrix sp. 336/3 TaxID=1337936 RepID=UPI001EE08EDC|nr:acyltransferase [Calothrix sp. 336/3]
MKPKVHFYFVDALRGIAALWVVLYHAALDDRLGQLTSILPSWLVLVVFHWGSLGVSIFFVLSGFVIAHSLREATINWSYFRSFCVRRLVRLTPPYYFSILLTLGFALIAARAKGEIFAPGGEPVSFSRFFTHLFYLQDIFQLKHFDDVYWTLCIEVQFYTIFCVLLGLSQLFKKSYHWQFSRAIIFLPLTAIATLFPLEILNHTGRPNYFLPLWYSFLLGVFAYWSWNKQLKSIYFYFYSTLLLTIGIMKSSDFVIASVIVAILLLEAGRNNLMQTWLKQKSLQFLGKISYSLYLSHTPILGAVVFITSKILNASPWSDSITLLLGISCSILFSRVMWQVFEKPSIKWSQNIKIFK